MLGAGRVVARRQRQQRADGVFGLGGNLHGTHSAVSAAPGRLTGPLLGWSRVRPRLLAASTCASGVREDLATFLPAVLAGASTSSSCVRRIAPTTSRVAARADGPDLSRLRASPSSSTTRRELALDRRAPTACTSARTTRRWRDCRDLLGPEAIVGLSTHADDEFDAALATSATYFSAGPIMATPTKPGRAGTGVDYASTLPGAQRPPGLRHRGRHRGQRRGAGRRRVAPLRGRARAHRGSPTPSGGARPASRDRRGDSPSGAGRATRAGWRPCAGPRAAGGPRLG